MTTEQIRKRIEVYKFVIYKDGIAIDYRKTNNKNAVISHFHYRLSPLQVASELSNMCEIDSYSTYEDLAFQYNGENLIWEEFRHKWTFSQYDALQLAIRHEYAKSLETDVNMLEMDVALAALKK